MELINKLLDIFSVLTTSSVQSTEICARATLGLCIMHALGLVAVRLSCCGVTAILSFINYDFSSSAISRLLVLKLLTSVADAAVAC